MTTSMKRDRPYDGQSHTEHGIRGATVIEGVTFRDLRDCLIRAYCLSSGPGPLYDEARKGEHAEIDENVIYTIKGVDRLAVAQNMSCEIERLMDIYPNLPKGEVA